MTNQTEATTTTTTLENAFPGESKRAAKKATKKTAAKKTTKKTAAKKTAAKKTAAKKAMPRAGRFYQLTASGAKAEFSGQRATIASILKKSGKQGATAAEIAARVDFPAANVAWHLSRMRADGTAK